MNFTKSYTKQENVASHDHQRHIGIRRKEEEKEESLH